MSGPYTDVMTPNRVLAESAPATTADAPRYTLLVAAGAAEIRAAQRLRYRVFAEEMGATLRQTVPGHDVDEFDAVCDHLIVRDERTGEAVGTYRIRPLSPWDHSAVTRTGRPELPPLLRGYLRLGAWVCGEPAHDPDFGVADLFVLLSLDRVNERYLKHFLGEWSR